jgi:hypothetical protein
MYDTFGHSIFLHNCFKASLTILGKPQAFFSEEYTVVCGSSSAEGIDIQTHQKHLEFFINYPNENKIVPEAFHIYFGNFDGRENVFIAFVRDLYVCG